MKTIKMKQGLMVDLLTIVESIPPKDFADLKSMRKADGAVKALRKAIDLFLKKLEKIQADANKVLELDRPKFVELNQKVDSEKDPDKKKLLELQRSELERRSNAKLEPFNEKIVKLRSEEGTKEIECEMDDNYHTELQMIFKDKCKDKITNRGAVIEVADALGIEE